MAIKKNPELITSGPYKFIRHPIYSGILLALLGTALTTIAIWFIILVIVAGYFVYSARQEEKLLIHQFPDEYAEYIKKTKAMIPFVW